MLFYCVYNSLYLLVLLIIYWLQQFFISVMTTSTPEKVDGLKALEGAIEKISDTISKLGGVFKVQMAVSQFDLT